MPEKASEVGRKSSDSDLSPYVFFTTRKWEVHDFNFLGVSICRHHDLIPGILQGEGSSGWWFRLGFTIYFSLLEMPWQKGCLFGMMNFFFGTLN